MSRPLRIDFIAPPFAGHLFPLLQLATGLRERGYQGLRILTTQSGGRAIEACDLPWCELLAGHESTILDLANPNHRVGSNPLRLLRQFRLNLALMPRLRDELEQLWQADRPDLVLADFTVPFAGLTAQTMGIPWWTGMPSPCALETGDGTPSYLGGWMPRGDWWGKLRDRGGWMLIRTFKRSVRWLFRRQFNQLSIPSVYRADGLEVAYSPEMILAFGMRELEFERRWPRHVHFVGPLTRCPPLPSAEPYFEPGRRHVLFTLGTHVHWARDKAERLLGRVAELLPECVFHCARGLPGRTGIERHGNLHFYDFLPYYQCLDRYDAAIIHGGTGIMYACLEHALPCLVWPQDYDQFDHAARIVQRGLGLRFATDPAEVARRLRQLFDDESIHRQLLDFQRSSREYDAVDWLHRRLQTTDL